MLYWYLHIAGEGDDDDDDDDDDDNDGKSKGWCQISRNDWWVFKKICQNIIVMELWKFAYYYMWWIE